MEPWSSRKQLGAHHGSPERPRVVLGFNECSWTHPIMLAPMSSIHHSLPKPSPILSKLCSNMFNYMSVVTQPNTSEFCVSLQDTCQKNTKKTHGCLTTDGFSMAFCCHGRCPGQGHVQSLYFRTASGREVRLHSRRNAACHPRGQSRDGTPGRLLLAHLPAGWAHPGIWSLLNV